MANRKKSRSGAARASTAPTSAPPPAPTRPPGARMRIAVGVLCVLVAAAAGYIAWHRGRDPNRVWARRVEQQFATKMTASLTRCFGGSDGAAIRRLIPDVRRGTWPAPFRGCAGPLLTEVVAQPMAFAADLGSPPSSAEDARMRLNDKLEHLRGSLAQLQRVTEQLPRNAPIPDDQRDRVAGELENVAVDADGLATAFGDAVRAANDGASFF